MAKKDEKNEKNFHGEKKNSPALLPLLEKACEGLIYVSETDAPVTAFVSDHKLSDGGDIIQQLVGKTDEPVSESDFGQFFARLTAIKDWHGEREKARAKKFLDLQKLIEENLSDRKVFRVGSVRLRIFVVGFDSEHRVAGVTTNAVET
ncbi:MAG: nuclease A inhibitor family protein [Pyrinomonadaceae bacterium]